MKKIYITILLLLNLIPVVTDDGITITIGEVNAQSMTDEMNYLPEVTCTASAPAPAPVSAPAYVGPDYNVSSEPPSYNPPPTPSDPCAYGGCNSQSSGSSSSNSTSSSTTEQNEDSSDTDEKPKEVDCGTLEKYYAKKSAKTFKEFTELPTLAEVDERNNLPSHYLPQSNTVLPMLNFHASNRFAEAGFTYEYRPGGSFVSDIQLGTTSQVSFPLEARTEALIHSHPMQHEGQPAPGPSPQDFVGLLEARIGQNCYRLNNSYVVAHGGATYALSITSSAKARRFYNQNKGQLGTQNGNFAQGSTFYVEFEAMRNYLKDQGFSSTDAHDAAMAYVLDKNDTGVKLMKKEKGEDEFKPMHTEGSERANGDIKNATPTKCK
jgi:hypothetical protein